jgi:hypothetical protein
MSRPDLRLERLFGDGATAFRAAFDLVPDPVGVLWAIRDPGGAIADFETGYSNPAMARMIGVPTEASIGRRLLQEAPDFGEDETKSTSGRRVARSAPSRRFCHSCFLPSMPMARKSSSAKRLSGE